MVEKTNEAPVTNRGAENTEKWHSCIDLKGQINNLNQFIIVDWFQATFFPDLSSYSFSLSDPYLPDIYELFFTLFGVDRTDVVSEKRTLNGYTMKYSYKNIAFYTNPGYLAMGINLLMSGSGCRDFEKLELDWYSFFKKVYERTSNINRIDIAIDDYTNKYFTLPKLQKLIRKGRVVSQFYKSLEIISRNLSTGESIGNTLQFGSKASRIQITFYDKLQERISENVEVSEQVQFWTRCEVRFRHEHAVELLRKILDNESLNSIVKGVLLYYIRFVDTPPTSFSDTNKSRWSTSKFWSDYLENIDMLKLSTLNPEHSITKKRQWLDKSVSKSNLMVMMSLLDCLQMDSSSSNYILELLQSGLKSLSSKDLQLINDYRLSKHLDRITLDELRDYVRDLKDVILISKKDSDLVE